MDPMELDPPLTNTFHLFSQLPPELRLKIWSYSLPGPRIIPICCGAKSRSLSLANPTSCTTTAEAPSSLHACHEARHEALKVYKPFFGFARATGQVLLNPARDVLYFGPRDGYMAAEAQFQTCMYMCDPNELAAVRRISISDALFWVDNLYYCSMTAASLTFEVLKQLATRMPGLKEVVFVLREEDTLAGPEATAGSQQRLKLQIMMGLQTVCLEIPSWKPPSWRVVTPQQFGYSEG